MAAIFAALTQNRVQPPRGVPGDKGVRAAGCCDGADDPLIQQLGDSASREDATGCVLSVGVTTRVCCGMICWIFDDTATGETPRELADHKCFIELRIAMEWRRQEMPSCCANEVPKQEFLGLVST